MCNCKGHVYLASKSKPLQQCSGFCHRLICTILGHNVIDCHFAAKVLLDLLLIDVKILPYCVELTHTDIQINTLLCLFNYRISFRIL